MPDLKEMLPLDITHTLRSAAAAPASDSSVAEAVGRKKQDLDAKKATAVKKGNVVFGGGASPTPPTPTSNVGRPPETTSQPRRTIREIS